MFNCPTCKKPVNADVISKPGGTFPFCSERCKLRDLGNWLDGKYQIPAEEHDDEADEAPSEVWVDPNAKKRSR